MRKFFKFSAWTLFVMLLASLIGAGLLMGLAQEGLSHGHWQIVVDGDTVANAQTLREAWHDEEWQGLEAFFGIAAALFCAVLLLPLLLLLGVGLPLFCVVLALGAVVASLLGVAAVLSAPLLIPLLLIVWLLRRSKPQAPAAG
jgi:hypothetical protein